MANAEHVGRLINQGVDAWNKWREEHADIRPDLVAANLTRAHLRKANLSNANLTNADLTKADLTGADLTGANLSNAHLSGADLSEADLREAHLINANLTDAILSGAVLFFAHLSGANLSNANLSGADLTATDLISADLTGAVLTGANLTKADLTGANLSGAVLMEVRLRETNVENANLNGCRIYGISAWNLRGVPRAQLDLIITHYQEPIVTIDNLEVAQFIYLLLNNRKIREVIDSVTSKAVLILGRFSPERKAVLDAIHIRLREDYGLVPILFDWEPSASRDLTETIVTLAGMCRFIIADLTDASSIPQELSHIIPTFQSVPIRPILLASKKEYAMYEHWENFNNVLPIFPYSDTNHLLENLQTEVIGPLENWESATDKEWAKRHEAAEREQRLRQEIAELKAQLRRQ